MNQFPADADSRKKIRREDDRDQRLICERHKDELILLQKVWKIDHDIVSAVQGDISEIKKSIATVLVQVGIMIDSKTHHSRDIADCKDTINTHIESHQIQEKEIRDDAKWLKNTTIVSLFGLISAIIVLGIKIWIDSGGIVP